MPSLLPGFQYDIFISYRQNDNRSGWVTEFVQALQDELAATLKDPLSIYFDSNPHDGLHETHDVDGSLKEKVKCLVFIPIVSQTYCDPKSFAWQNEFLPYLDFAKQDAFGLDVMLPSGNVSKRVLPIRIHEIEEEDKKLFEDQIGGVMRPVDFIYSEAGVNRPLAPDDSDEKNLNKTKYKNQVNKVANAIKDILSGIKSSSAEDQQKYVDPQKEKIKELEKIGLSHSKKGNLRLVLGVLLIALVAIAYLFWPAESPDSQERNIDKSLVVLPFEDLSPDRDQEWFSDGLAEEILNRLANVEELKLISRTTSFSFKGSGLSAKKIADSLDVSYVLEGSVRKVDNTIRVTTQLINASDDSHLWSNTYDYMMDSVFHIQEDISENITSSLNILLDPGQKENMLRIGTRNVEAYERFLRGLAIYGEAHGYGGLELLVEANVFFEEAISLDPEFGAAYEHHADLYSHNLVGEENFETLSGQTEQEKYAQMVEDYNNAIKYASSDALRLSYQFDLAVLSGDWGKIPELMEKNATSGWDPITIIIDPDYRLSNRLERIEREPYLDLERTLCAITYMFKDRLDSAILLLESPFAIGSNSLYTLSLAYMKQGNYKKALNQLETNNMTSGYTYLLAQLLSGAIDTKQQVYDRINSINYLSNSIGESAMGIYNVLGEYDKADSIANLIDSRILGSTSLFSNIIFGDLSFHLEATPNFVENLRELGIDPEEFEKERYSKYPLVELE